MERFTRRSLIAGALGIPVAAQALVDLKLPGGPAMRPVEPRFPQKGEMIVQRVRPPLLETPFDVFREGTITPNDRHFVRWHYDVPTSIDVTTFRLTVRGAVKTPLSLTLPEVVRAGHQTEFVAVNQCAGNSRGFSEPRVIGAQWAHGAMSNAKWRGVRLRDLLDKAGVGADAKFVRFKGLETPLVDGAPHFMKSVPIDIARRDDTIVAFAMNGEALPLLNGFPLRIVIPGWFSTYWVKMLTDIEVLTAEDDNFWMAKAYRWPSVLVKPGDKDFPTVPIAAMPPRSWITSHSDGGPMGSGALSGLAMGGDCGIERVDVIANDFAHPATLEPEDGPYGFRRWRVQLARMTGAVALGARTTNTKGVSQPFVAIWNPSGYARNPIERITVTA